MLVSGPPAYVLGLWWAYSVAPLGHTRTRERETVAAGPVDLVSWTHFGRSLLFNVADDSLGCPVPGHGLDWQDLPTPNFAV